MGLIISTAHLQKVLPSDASDDNNEITNAVTEATALVNTWTSRHYETWDAYSGTDTSNAPREIVYICTQIAKHLYYQNIGSVTRDGREEVDHEERIEYYRRLLEKIDVQPVKYTKTIVLDSDGYMLIARDQNILTHKGYIVSLLNYSSSSSVGLSSSSSVGLSSSSSMGLSSSLGLSSSSEADD